MVCWEASYIVQDNTVVFSFNRPNRSGAGAKNLSSGSTALVYTGLNIDAVTRSISAQSFDSMYLLI